MSSRPSTSDGRPARVGDEDGVNSVGGREDRGSGNTHVTWRQPSNDIGSWNLSALDGVRAHRSSNLGLMTALTTTESDPPEIDRRISPGRDVNAFMGRARPTNTRMRGDRTRTAKALAWE
jgi:hypothetical protein